MARIVVKIGSNIIAGSESGLDAASVERLAGDIAAASDLGHEIIVVSSGAVAAGMGKLGLAAKPKDIKVKQAVAAVGQSSLMWCYEKAFGVFGKKVGQVLLTREDFSDRRRYINSKNTLLTLLSFGVIPVINENDTVATDEIRFGDNDNLAALVAILIAADNLMILSDVEGLYDRNPSADSAARIISSVHEITAEVERVAGGSGSSVGTGGMYSKVLAAKKATSHGIPVRIINGRNAGLLLRAVRNEPVGTLFSAARERLSHRKGWIAFSSRSRGSVILDDGAVRAIVEGGKSLLPSGIAAVEGDFDTGDAVYCVGGDGRRIAKGLINYPASDLRKILRKKSSEIERVLGYMYSEEAIHRDNLVVLERERGR
ncbi:MAG: glutamate 5-kinase [Thermodesulfovibrionales bacterium]